MMRRSIFGGGGGATGYVHYWWKLLMFFCDSYKLRGSRGNAVGIATILRAGWAGVQIPVGARDILLLQNVQSGPWGSPSLQLNVYRGSLLEVKRPGREINNSPHLMSRLRMIGAIPALPLYAYAFVTWPRESLLYFVS